jgi:hypothetical protein
MINRFAGIAAFCALTGFAGFAHAQAVEVKVSDAIFGDTEFDWGRDGISCPTCNFGEGNNRFNWTDTDGNLWIGHLNPATGAITPANGKSELADTSAFNWNEFGNGPEWAFSTQNGQVISQLVYTRYIPGQPAIPANAGVAFATPVQGGWSAQFFPGAIGTQSNGTPFNTVLPEASQCNSDPVAYTLYKDLSKPKQMFWEYTTDATGTAPVPTPIGSYANGIAERWVPCTTQFVFEGTAPTKSPEAGYTEVYWYDTATQAVQLLTSDFNNHSDAFMFQAPELNDAYVLVTMSSNLALDVYEQTGVEPNGAPIMTLINHITSPDPSEPYMSTSEPFINCTPTCQTYEFFSLSSVASKPTRSTPNGYAVAAINPAQPMFKILVAAESEPLKQRADPEYFITPNGPYLYYTRITALTPTTPYRKEGQFYMDMGLGAPSGPCVGSSAEGGMLPGC